MNDSIQTLKITLIGDSAVGKTSFIMRLLYDNFDSSNMSTIGVSFFSAIEKASNGTNYKLHIWETAGQEKFRSLVPMYLRNADIILLVYDLSESQTLDNLTDFWISYIQKGQFDKEPIYFLIGTKSDLLDIKTLNNINNEMKYYMSHNSMFSNFIPVSSLNGQNIESAKKIILDTVYKKRNANNNFMFDALMEYSLYIQTPNDYTDKCCA